MGKPPRPLPMIGIDSLEILSVAVISKICLIHSGMTLGSVLNPISAFLVAEAVTKTVAGKL